VEFSRRSTFDFRSPGSRARSERLILAILVALTLAAWIATVVQSGSGGMGMGLTMGLTGPLFLAIWSTMMAAMMFPSSAPMILAFACACRDRRGRHDAFVPTLAFAGAYLLVWVGAGGVAFLLAQWLQNLGMQSMWLMHNAARFAGLVFVAAGVYQLSPPKRMCLAKCRSPQDFVFTSWRDGYLGAVQMGLRHGQLCLGCCWLLFAILFPLGVMSVPAMAVLALLIFAEKILPAGIAISRGVGAALTLYGILVLALPQALPLAGRM